MPYYTKIDTLCHSKTSYWEGEDTNHGKLWKKFWKLISWAKEANGKKLRGNCAFVTKQAELWEIKCSTKLTIICEESF